MSGEKDDSATTPMVEPGTASWLRVLAGVGLSVLGGVALVLAFPRYGGFWPLLFVALVPMLFAQYRLFPRKLSGLAPGLTVGVFWLGGLDQLKAIVDPWFIAVGGVAAGIVWGLLFSLGRAFNERTSFALFMIEMPALWVAIDVLRSGSEYLGSGGWLAYDLADAPSLIQPVSIFSTPALTFLILAINGAVGLALLAIYDRGKGTAPAIAVPPRVAKVTFALVCVVAVGWFGLSALLFARPLTGPEVKVAVAQIGTTNTQGELGDIKFTPELAAQFTQMTEQAAKQGAQYVVWPELILSFDPRLPSNPFVADLAKQANVYIMAGFTSDGDETQNMSVLFDPTGNVVGSYQKNHPVTLMNESWDRQPAYPVWPTRFATVGPIICFDISFPSDSAHETVNGAQIIMAPSGGPASTSSDQYREAQFRAVENQVAMVKGDWAWGSAIVEPNGSLVTHTENLDPAGEEKLLIGSVHVGSGEGTFFSHYPNIFTVIVYLAVLARIVIQIWTAPVLRRRRHGTRQPQ
ncbi:MAG: nitrilase-related carbon-nitrogen hydrolase [Candidatus Nanopelagicales bacterium]|nr:nitrilase-related carbon-nitrogen hydrolase [Candidatus Nanopelagicales bacterium]